MVLVIGDILSACLFMVSKKCMEYRLPIGIQVNLW